LVIVILHNFTFIEILGIPLGAHFTYLNSVTNWPEDGLRKDKPKHVAIYIE